MGNKLEAFKKVMLEGPVTIDSTTTTDVLDMSSVENRFAIQLDYVNGVGLDADLIVEISVNGRNFVQIPTSSVNLTDTTGTHIWDFSESGANYVRVKITINSGSMDINEITFSGKERH